MTASSAEPLLPVALGAGRMPYARGIAAGPWVFASGVLATDFETGVERHVLAPARPRSAEPRWYSEARRMYERANEVLLAGGSDFSHTVRTDQYFPDWRAVPFLHQVRRERCGDYVAPSTSVLEPALPLTDAGMSMDVIAVRNGREVKSIFPSGLEIPSTSSFVPVVVANGLIFVAGFMAAWQRGDLGGIAPEAKVPEGHLWKGNRIQLEVDYIIRQKLIPALEGAGATLSDVVKAQIYVADIDDVPALNQVWRRHFGTQVPATTYIPTLDPGFAIADARCEINLIARASLGADKQTISGALPPTCEGLPNAIRCGDLVFFSGMVASGADGLVREARVDPRQPYFGSSIESQMECLLDEAERICETAGTSLRNSVRIQQFHTDLNELYAAWRVWQRRLPGTALPLSAVQVPGPLVVPGCTVQLDLWVYAPLN